MTFAAGVRVGPYEVLGPIGTGGMGEVWRALDLKLRVEVALKALREDLLGDERRRDLLAKLCSLTNLRAVENPASDSGWKLEPGPFPGWAEVPDWWP